MNFIFWKEGSLKRTLAGILIIMVFASGILTACASKNNGDGPEKSTGAGTEETVETGKASPEEQGNNEEKIMDDYRELVENSTTLDEVLKFIDENISLVSSENASKMVDGFEGLQGKFFGEVEDKFYNSNSLQDELAGLYQTGEDINKADNIKDAESRELLEEALNTGYKVETAEGMFFPVINYEFYKKYSDYVSPDMREYIDIMAVESNEAPAKDAALMISWEEVLKRTLAREKFINRYESSPKLGEIERVYGWYLRYALFGLDNTPLFEYGSNTMDAEAKEAYMQAIEDNSDSKFLKILKDYMGILEKNDYTLTDEVNAYRESIVKDFQ